MLKKYWYKFKINKKYNVKTFKNRFGFKYDYINYSNKLNINDIIKYNSTDTKKFISIRLNNINQLKTISKKIDFINLREVKTEIKKHGFVDITLYQQQLETITEI